MRETPMGVAIISPATNNRILASLLIFEKEAQDPESSKVDWWSILFF